MDVVYGMPQSATSVLITHTFGLVRGYTAFSEEEKASPSGVLMGNLIRQGFEHLYAMIQDAEVTE